MANYLDMLGLSAIAESVKEIMGLFDMSNGLDVGNIVSTLLNVVKTMFGSLGGAMASFGIIGFVIISIVVGVVLIAYFIIGYLLPAIALFKMGKKAGYKQAWFAFVPILQTYASFVIPRERYKLLFINTGKRNVIAIVYLITSILWKLIKSLLSFVLNLVIPGFGTIVATIIKGFFWLIFSAFNWRKMYDIFFTYKKKGASIALSIIGVFIPAVYSIALLTCIKQEPKFGKGNYYSCDMSKKVKE